MLFLLITGYLCGIALSQEACKECVVERGIWCVNTSGGLCLESLREKTTCSEYIFRDPTGCPAETIPIVETSTRASLDAIATSTAETPQIKEISTTTAPDALPTSTAETTPIVEASTTASLDAIATSTAETTPTVETSTTASLDAIATSTAETTPIVETSTTTASDALPTSTDLLEYREDCVNIMSTLTPAGSESSISGLLTCMTCRVGFRDGDLQRDHYKSDWHRYNLKRKIVLLPPVTAENFADRVAAQEALQVESSKDTSKYCTVCKKSFGNEKAFQSHIISKKHSAMIKELSLKNWIEPQNELAKDMNAKCAVKIADDGTVLSSSPGKSPGTGKKFPQSPQTLIKSGFPGKGQKLKEDDMEIESDDDSWEEIEGTPVPINSCLFCSHESKDLEANLEHMSISHSFFIPDVEYCTDIEGLLDYLGSKVGEGMMCLWCNEKGKAFYNVLAVQQHMTDKGHCKMLHDGDAAFEYSDYYDFSSSYPDGSDQVNADEAYQAEPIRFNESMQLVLPNGMALGHRALRVYYRQYVRPAARALAGSRKAKKHNILSQYKAIGYGQTPANIAQQKLRNQRYFKLIKDKYHMKLGMSGNKTLQNYFRRQVQF